MSNISNKKKKFIKINFKQLSIEELARQTGLKSNVIKSLIDEYSAETPGKDQSARTKKRACVFLSGKFILLTSLIFAVTAFIIYTPSLQGDFVFDDIVAIQDNPLIYTTSLSQLTDLMAFKDVSYTRALDNRKIAFMSFALNYYFGGLNTFGYHLVNVIIHSLNGLILFLLSYTILILPLDEGKGRGKAFTIAFLGSLVWLVHPIQTQAVSYIYQRLTSLAALFFLLSLLCYIKGRGHQDHKRFVLFTLSLFFGLLALGTKQNTATLPFFIILSEFFFFQPQPFKMEKKKLIFLLLFGGLFLLIAGIYIDSDFFSRMAQCYQERGWTPLERMLTQLRVVIFYFSLLVYPHPSRLNLDHDFLISYSLFSPPTTFLSLSIIIGLLALAIFLMRKNRLVSFAIFWFLGNLVIESSIIPLELVFEHRLYLPSMGFIMLFVGICFSLTKVGWENWVTSAIILFVLLFSCWTYERASVWREQISLWMDAAKKSPSKARPHSNLGSAYAKKDMLDKSISESKKALAIKPNYAKAHNNLGVVYVKKGKLDEAISEFKKTIVIKPHHAKAHNNLGIVYVKKGRLDEAISEFKKTIAIKPHHAMAYFNLGLAYDKKGMANEAIGEFKKVIVINPNFAEAYHRLGLALQAQGNESDSISAYRNAIRLKPDYHEAYNSLAWIYATSPNVTIRNGDEAVALATKACELTDFKKAEALDTLAAAYAEQDNFRKAVEYQHQAIEQAIPQIKKELQKHLQLYQSGHAYQDQ